MRSSNIPVVGFTWYSLIDQVDWNVGLGRPLGNVNPVGLFDLNRDPRPVGQAYQHLLRMFRSETLLTGVQIEDLDGVLGLGRATRPRGSDGRQISNAKDTVS
jgi:hypothetical protein